MSTNTTSTWQALVFLDTHEDRSDSIELTLARPDLYATKEEALAAARHVMDVLPGVYHVGARQLQIVRPISDIGRETRQNPV